MKNILLVIVATLIIGGIVNGAVNTDRIEKIGENNIEVTPRKIITDIDGITFEIWDENAKKSYGQDALDRQIPNANQALIDAESFDCKVYKQSLIDKAQEKIDRLDLIQQKMSE